MPGKPEFRIGVESFLPGAEDWWATIYSRWMGKQFTGEKVVNALRDLGAQFTLCYDSLSRDKKDAVRRITDLFGGSGIGFLLNNTYGDIYGPWMPGRGMAEYSDADLEYASQSPNFLGVILDEFAHRQIHQIDCGRNGPYLADVKGLSPIECYDALLEEGRKLVERHARFRCPLIAEYVFPSLYHLFARAGITPAPKLLKESADPVMLAIAIGAAKQYGTDLWAVADLWGGEPFWASLFGRPNENGPGHSPDEYLSSLLIAYWMGVDCLYTEGIHNLVYPFTTTDEERRELIAHPVGHRGASDPMTFGVRDRGYLVNVYGKFHRWFATEYVPEHPRGYSFRDVEPRIAIVRFPDSCWCKRGLNGLLAHTGERDSMFGPHGPLKRDCNEAWLDLWPILTHGQAPNDSLWLCAGERDDRLYSDNECYPSNHRHPAFYPIDGVVVYDHLVEGDLLKGLELIVCTGETVSEGTSAAIAGCVERGASCLILDHLAPRGVTRDRHGSPIVRRGRGEFMIVPDFRSPEVRRFVTPFLGDPNEIRYRFGGRDVVISPVAGDRNRVTAAFR